MAADGWIHKAVVLGSGMHIIEETQVFKEPQSVDNLVISPTQVPLISDPQYVLAETRGVGRLGRGCVFL